MSSFVIITLNLIIKLSCALYIKGTLPPKTIFQYVKQSWPLIIMSYVFCSRNSIKKRKYNFSKISRDSMYLKNEYRKRKVYLKNEYRKRKVYPKNGYRKRILLSNIVPEKNLVPKNFYHQNILIILYEFRRGTFGNIVLVTLGTMVTPFTIKRDK